MKTVHFDLPDDVLDAVGEEQAGTLAREALLVKLYDLGEISTGKAAEILGISRREFLDVLGRYGVSEYDDTLNVADEARRG